MELLAEGIEWCRVPEDRVDVCRSPGAWTVERAPLELEQRSNRSAHGLDAIKAAVDRSCVILSVPGDLDGECRPRVETRAWRRATLFLTRYAKHLWDAQRRRLAVPDILPGPDGSVDLHWDYPDYEMLINVPAAGPAGFYGDDRGRISIKGQFDPAQFNEGLLLWLTKAA